MITRISIKKAATFHPTEPQVLADLCEINYIFGSNGTGKTTISRVIADAAFSASSDCAWKSGRPLKALVLNRDFVEKNFDQLRGVFTLGEKAKDTEDKINAAKAQLDKEADDRDKLNRTLAGDDGNGGKKGDLEQLESDFRDKCWAPVEKIKKGRVLAPALRGVLDSKAKFMKKVLQEAQTNTAAVKDPADLERRADTIFGEPPTKQSVYPTINDSALLAHESHPILKKKVIGKEDVNIAAMITKLGNSDWVRQGLPSYKQNDGFCPFCQQETTEQFAESLNAYFDEAFEQDTNTISTLISDYATDAAAVQSTVTGIIGAPSKFIDIEKLKAETSAFEKTTEANKLRLANKKKEPSQVVALDSVEAVLVAIKEMINVANAEIEKYNTTIDNLADERRILTNEVWRYVLDELDVDLKQYRKNKEALDKAVAGLEGSIEQCQDRIDGHTHEIRTLESQTTSIQPTINAINRTLKQFGFDSFTLADTGDGKHYKLIRTNGENAKRTLSEGEKTFVVFLYFYHLIQGSFSPTDMTTDRIVVFDDPVSSLDSDVLFIVSSLIRKVCESCRNPVGNIKQVFILTHNVYFHKEVSYNNKRPPNNCLHDESFWIVRKINQYSQCTRHTCNPIKTSYELLWEEVREAELALQNGDQVNARVENILRRVLEHYFSILGSIDYKKECEKFEGQDKLICNSLFSWVNAGSHSALDDAYVTPSDAITRNALRVFKEIFEKSSHGAHYLMMMGGIEGVTAAGTEAGEVV